VKVPYSWLCSYCDPELSVEEVAEKLGMHSFEVERVSHVGARSPDGFVVGKVLSVENHPEADRLSVCEVETGDGARTIVCGAPNVAAGQTVPVALPGAVLPDGTELGKAKLRGVESDGMILSEIELGIGEDAEGIIVLGESDGEPIAEPGTSLAEVLSIAEPVIELEPGSNRIDCFGVYGVARELHAITGAELAPAPWESDEGELGAGGVGDYASVTVEVPELCPRFTARVFTDVDIRPSPPWLKARLTAAGQRPINNVVDITNYVMLLTAQPSHAFDLDLVPGGELNIRSATEGETLVTLDGEERSFDAETVLVCDRDGPSAIAGIMGGQRSEVSESTRRVLLEVATWNGVNILRSSRKLGLRSDASNRFEKQLHPEMALRAQRIAAKLMSDVCGAKLVPGTIDVAAEIPEPRKLRLEGRRAEGLLGMKIDSDKRAEYLRRLEFGVSEDGEDLEVEVPVHRHYDVTREVDLVEEVGRIHGYAANLPSTLPERAAQAGRLASEQSLRRRAEDVMRDLGFDGVVTLSLTDPGMANRLRIPTDDPRARPIAVSNPLSREHSALRTTLFATLLDVAQHNLAHGAERVALYESGRVYLSGGSSTPLGGVLAGEFVGERPPPTAEPQRIAALGIGELRSPGWRGAGVPADFYALKGSLEALCHQLGVQPEFGETEEPFLHPGRAAEVRLNGHPSGWLGELHPLVARSWELPGGAGFEFDLADLIFHATVGRERYEDVVSYPALHEDIAVTVGEEIEAAAVRGAVMEGGGELLRSARIFDLYRGEQVGEGHKSLALRLEFRAADRTLTDEEVAERREQIKQALERLGGSLRE
jgi:phenylalanyl-tRNA synthetase beta chain